METYKRVIHPTTSMEVTITYRSDGRLSLNGRGTHGSGQIHKYLTKDKPAPWFTNHDCFRLQCVWERWHLNDMRAGTPRQEEAVRKWRPKADDPGFKAACKMLESIDLLTDNGYRYGSGWLKEDVPEEILKWLFTLPGTGHTYAEVYTPEIKQIDLDAILNIKQ